MWYEAYKDYKEDGTQTVDKDTDLQNLINRNFRGLLHGDLKIDRWEEKEGTPQPVESVDLKYWLLDWFLMENPYIDNDLRDEIGDLVMNHVSEDDE